MQHDKQLNLMQLAHATTSATNSVSTRVSKIEN